MKRLVRFDWAAKKLLRSKANFDVLEGFLSELLGEDIKIKNILESEGNKEAADDKFNRVDLLVENSKGEIIIIEIQVEDQLDYIQRLIYGTAKVITEYIKESVSYSEIKKVISISVLYFDLGQGDDYIYHGTTKLTGIHSHEDLKLSKKQQEEFQKDQAYELFPEYYLIKVNQFNDLAKDTLDEWIYFLKNEIIDDNFTAKGLEAAKEKLDVMKLPEEEQVSYKYYLESLHDRASFYESTFVQGEKKGREEGMKEGENKGKIEGKIEGRMEEKLEVAEKLLKKGMSVEDIIDLTGLKKEQIEKLD
ncbi:Rpn family recombination-promoting nuclease/putative transposase [Candidatus Desantisbacteria bacterium]|nr:Rpn family recombination-promoting nuclease/putative transposase [Candidatus Desantisbacteria bacterium]